MESHKRKASSPPSPLINGAGRTTRRSKRSSTGIASPEVHVEQAEDDDEQMLNDDSDDGNDNDNYNGDDNDENDDNEHDREHGLNDSEIIDDGDQDEQDVDGWNGPSDRFHHRHRKPNSSQISTVPSIPPPLKSQSVIPARSGSGLEPASPAAAAAAAASGAAELIPIQSVGDSVEWQRTIEKVVRSVVSIRFAQIASFDCEPALVSEATGFVVDAERGLIMTNRHVVGAGPFTGFAVFDNHEECDVQPIYRDPVHDFGILRFNPADIKYMPVTALDLRPELARVGAEIRVIGNDAGEKLSILSGFISRLDRNAPDYGDLSYNDFNTEYIQAAASASGGSSGSPVVNIDGHAVAIQAGGSSESSTDYFLPLYRGLRALRCVQDDTPITRGTIQIQWLLKPFDECRRLGLTPEIEYAIRKEFPDGIGMLVAETVLPEGPSDGLIEEGDCLVSVNGEHVTKFIRLDEVLDSTVSSEIAVVVQRGGQNVNVTITVGDLHAITPDRYVEVAGACFHNVSYQLARQFVIPAKGVYISEPSGSFRLDRDRGWILESLDDDPTPDLDTFISAMKKIRDRQWVVASCRNVQDMHSQNISIVYIDRHWASTFRMAMRNDKTGLWDFTQLGDSLPAEQLRPQSARFTEVRRTDIGQARKLIRSFVKVTCLIPLKIDGFPRSGKVGQGLVVDADRGLVVVARSIVPYDLCDVVITVADSIMVPGKVNFLHPTQGWAVVSYDPNLVDAPIETAELRGHELERNTSTIFMGFNQNMRMVVAPTNVTDVTTKTAPANNVTPRYRVTNVDVIAVDTVLGSQCGSGVLVGTDGVVDALWLTYLGERHASNGRDVEYRAGISTVGVSAVLAQLRAGVTAPVVRILDADLCVLQMNQARIRGVTDAWIRKVEQANDDRHQLFAVRKLTASTVSGPADKDHKRGHNKLRQSQQNQEGLQEGDVILAVNGTTLTRISELDAACANASGKDNWMLDLTVVRGRRQISLRVSTVPTTDIETDRVVIWCGAVLHEPHHAVRQQIKNLHSGVYVSGRMHGSPAYQYGVAPTYFLTHVNGVATPDLDSFLKAVVGMPDNTYLRLRIVTFENMPFASSIKSNRHYFPTIELVSDKTAPDGWRRKTYE
ncbi:trypsin-like cysteine/serine peptidase domain-containing protein [Lipomyces japonicus]|uniref:trypsin-like cysteine/serine peptidase domain-containing protein n=1 Tax=Lipomyces japonicus TaxID=56871 RepID=UPI0034CD4549